MVVFGSYDGNVYALDAHTGEFRWSYTTGGRVVSSPAISNGVVYVGSYDHFVYAIDSVVEPQPNAEPWSAWMIAAVIVLIVLIVLVSVLILRLLNKP